MATVLLDHMSKLCRVLIIASGVPMSEVAGKVGASPVWVHNIVNGKGKGWQVQKAATEAYINPCRGIGPLNTVSPLRRPPVRNIPLPAPVFQ